MLRGVAALALAAALAACDDGATIGGTVAGLRSGTSITLQDNHGEQLTLTGDQGFSFPTRRRIGARYQVTVLAQPVGETCAVANASGRVDPAADNGKLVVVTCKQNASAGRKVAGLAAGNSS